jgi:hypothetical protein
MSDDTDTIEPPRGQRERKTIRDAIPHLKSVRCDQPGCDFVARSAAGLGVHKSTRHGIPGTDPKSVRNRERVEGRQVRGDEKGPRPTRSAQGVTAAYAKGKVGRFAEQIDRREYHETAAEIREGLEDIAETLEELSKRSDTAAEVIRWGLLLIGSGAAILTIGAVAAAWRRDRLRKLELRRREAEGVDGTSEPGPPAQFGVRQFFGRRPGSPGSSSMNDEETALGLS